MSASINFKSTIEQQVYEVLSEHGPMVGQGIKDRLGDIDSMELWRICYQSNLFRITSFSRYYLRYDITRDNQLRLSPSILRNFLTYSLVYRKGQQGNAVEQGTRLANKHRAISNRKIGVARKAILSLEEGLREKLNQTCSFFVSGDLAYFLGHDVPRLHKQTEVIINGSDIDIVIVYNTEVTPDDIAEAERQILKFKYKALKAEGGGEEIDFIFKPVSKLMNQLQYRDIHEKIASKILYESFFLYGRLDIYDHLLTQMRLLGTEAKIENDFDTALQEREQTIGKILGLISPIDIHKDKEVNSLFFFSQERLEFQ